MQVFIVKQTYIYSVTASGRIPAVIVHDLLWATAIELWQQVAEATDPSSFHGGCRPRNARHLRQGWSKLYRQRHRHCWEFVKLVHRVSGPSRRTAAPEGPIFSNWSVSS